MFRQFIWFSIVVSQIALNDGRGLADTPAATALNEADEKQIQDGLDRLRDKLARALLTLPDAPNSSDLFADARVFRKGLTWALRYDSAFTSADVALMKKALQRGQQRADSLQAGKNSWSMKKGLVARGYKSQVDGSIQPYGVIVPAGYDPKKPMRLDVVLHGSTKPVGLSELRFMNRFDDGDEGGKPAPQVDYIELHPLGRVENCYRWAGETDVFEAIEAVCRNYNIDRDRIVLRGMSMGASGTWHLGLKHPDKFVALGPYCGYVDTHQFSLTPLPHFVKVGVLPNHQEKALHMIDSIDYAANAGVVPAIACMGEKDIFFDAHVLMGKAMEKEGLKMVNLISPGTGHVIDPVTHKEQMRRLGEYAAKGLDHAPRQIRFVTWTLKYNRCHWLEILGLTEHYARAEVEAQLAGDGAVEVKVVKNTTRLAIHPPMLQGPNAKLRIAGSEVVLPAHGAKDIPRTPVLEFKDGKWQYLGDLQALSLPGKRPGLQGPIDDAFTTSFLCVRGTGKPWNPAIQAWSDASLKRFAHEWRRYYRGELPITDDKDVTEADLRSRNLILFGDPGSNRWIRAALPKLPLKWTARDLEMGGVHYDAGKHAPLLIQPNPLPGGENRYLVLNSGHTFHEKEWAINYLLFPRLGDWAVLKVGDKIPEQPSEPLDEEVIQAGFCDEGWRIPKKADQK